MPIFLILSILTDHNLFGSDVEQDCSYTVFAVVFYLNLTLSEMVHSLLRKLGVLFNLPCFF